MLSYLVLVNGWTPTCQSIWGIHTSLAACRVPISAIILVHLPVQSFWPILPNYLALQIAVDFSMWAFDASSAAVLRAHFARASILSRSHSYIVLLIPHRDDDGRSWCSLWVNPGHFPQLALSEFSTRGHQLEITGNKLQWKIASLGVSIRQ